MTSEVVSSPLAIILHCVDEEYRRRTPDLFQKVKGRKIDWDRILKITEENKLSYYFSRRVIEIGYSFDPIFHKELVVGENNAAKLKRTLNFIFTFFEELERDFIIIKLYRGLPHVTSDIDVMIRDEDFCDVARTLENHGMENLAETVRLKKIKQLQHRRYEAFFWKRGFLEIELYTDFSWARLPTLDSSVVWRNRRTADVSDIKCPIPSYEADILLLLDHALFKDLGKITLLDFLYINSLLKRNISLKNLLQSAKEYGWDNSLLTLISTIREINHVIYRDESTPTNVMFPYHIPPSLITHSIWKLLSVSRKRGEKIHPFTIPGYGLFFGSTIKDRLYKAFANYKT